MAKAKVRKEYARALLARSRPEGQPAHDVGPERKRFTLAALNAALIAAMVAGAGWGGYEILATITSDTSSLRDPAAPAAAGSSSSTTPTACSTRSGSSARSTCARARR